MTEHKLETDTASHKQGKYVKKEEKSNWIQTNLITAQHPYLSPRSELLRYTEVLNGKWKKGKNMVQWFPIAETKKNEI